MDDPYVTEKVCALKHKEVDAVIEDIKEIKSDIKDMKERTSVTGWKIIGAVLIFLTLVANIVIAFMKG